MTRWLPPSLSYAANETTPSPTLITGVPVGNPKSMPRLKPPGRQPHGLLTTNEPSKGYLTPVLALVNAETSPER
jgi:hypothetical protein